MNTATESVSICIPAYNGEAYLREALQSAVNQTHRHAEVLIVDDGSTDDTLPIAREFAAAHPQVRLVQNTAGKGMVSNWERCVAEAAHDWIKFLFQDDLLKPDCVEKMLALCSKWGAGFAFCRRDFLVEANAPEEAVEYTRVVNKPERLFARGLLPPDALAQGIVENGTANIIGEPSCWLFQKKLLERLGPFDARFKQSVDFEFAVRTALTEGVAFTPEALVQFRIHGGSQTTANTGGKTDPATAKKSIRSLWGDDILLLSTFLTDGRFKLIRALWTEEELSNRIRYLYLKACRRFGAGAVREALHDVIPAVPAIRNLRYNYLRYKIEKHRFKKYQRNRKSK